jgi:hypothetical protein
MANVVSTQLLEQGARNTVVKWTGLLDTSDEAYNVKLLPASPGIVPTPSQWRLDYLWYSISDGLEIQLFWDATSPTLIVPLAGRGKIDYCNFGGLQNDAGAGKTGGLGMAAISLPGVTYTAGKPFTYSLTLELVKQGV